MLKRIIQCLESLIVCFFFQAFADKFYTMIVLHENLIVYLIGYIHNTDLRIQIVWNSNGLQRSGKSHNGRFCLCLFDGCKKYYQPNYFPENLQTFINKNLNLTHTYICYPTS